MKNLFEAIIGRIKLRHTLRSLYSSPNELEESTSLVTFICPCCGFHLQLSPVPFVEASNRSKSKRNPRRLRQARSFPVATDRIVELEGPPNIAPRPHYVIHPPTTEPIIPFEEPLDTVSSFPYSNHQPEMQSSHIETHQRSQFKFRREMHQSSQFKFPHHFTPSESAQFNDSETFRR